MVSLLAHLRNYYKEDVDFDILAIQLAMLPDLLKTANEKYQLAISKVTNIRTICELFNSCDIAKTMLGEVFKL